MKVSTQQFKLKRLVLITGLVFGMAACNTDDLAPPPPPPLVNSVPNIVTTAPVTANEGQLYSYRLVATDLDADALTYSATASTWLTVDAATGLLSGTPTATDVGENEITITVSDGTDSVTETATITVIAALAENVAPVFTSTPEDSGAVGEAYFYAVTAEDGNFDPLSFVFSGDLPAWATFTTDATTGMTNLTGTPDVAGSYPVEFIVSDGVFDTTQTFNISVSGPAVVTVELVVFENEALAGWAAWTDNGGPTELVTDDVEHDVTTRFTLTKPSVAGFSARPSETADGVPFDASGIISNGTLSFELKMEVEPLSAPANWFLKLEGLAGSAELNLSASVEGHSTPVLDTWLTYTFPLADIAAAGNLDFSGINLFMVFPNYNDANGAQYLLDNFMITSSVGGDTGGGEDPNGPELLTNGDFEAGLTGWKDGVGSVVVEDGNNVFEALVDTATTNVYDINQSNIFDITEGETYVFSFRAKASVARTIVAGLGLNSGDFFNISETVPLTTEWQTFTTEVVAVGIGGVGSRVLIDMGVEVGNVYVDDVSVKVKDGADTGGGNVEGEALTNGNFEDGLASWKGDVGAVVDDGGNNIFEAIIETSTTNVYDINQSQIFDITEGATYRFSYRAKASVARTMLAGLGLNSGDFFNISETVDLTTEWQTFTIDIVADGIGGVGSRVLFDMGVGVGNINIDDVSVILLPAE